jgi:hypothetical protein
MPGRHGNRVAPASAERRHSKITTGMAALLPLLPGSLVERRTRRQPPLPMPRRPSQLYGPYLTWTRKVENKTVTRTLNPEQARCSTTPAGCANSSPNSRSSPSNTSKTLTSHTPEQPGGGQWASDSAGVAAGAAAATLRPVAPFRARSRPFDCGRSALGRR